MSQIKKLAGQTAIYGLSTILGRFINYLLTPLQTRVFNSAQYGIVTGMYAYITFFNVLLTHGMETAFFRFAQKRENQPLLFSTSLRSVAVISILFLSLCFGFADAIAAISGFGVKPIYIQYVALIIALDALSAIPFAYLRLNNKALQFAIIKNSGIFLNIVLNLYFLLLAPYCLKNYGMTLPFFVAEVGVAYIFISNFLSSLLTFILLLPVFSKISSGFDRQLWKEMIIYALPMMVVGFAGMINEAIDRILLIYLYPNKEVAMQYNGIYGANYKLSIVITLFIQAFKYAAEPFFFSQAKNSDKREVYAEVMNIFILVCLTIFLVVTLFLDEFQRFVGPSFREGLAVVPWLLWANIFLGIYYNLSVWYKLTDQTGKGAWISVGGASITVVLNIILIPTMGYMGCAVTTFICYFAMMLTGYLWGQQHYKIPYEWKKFLLYSALAMILYISGNFLHQLFQNQKLYQHLLGFALLGVFVTTGYLAERKKLVL